MKNKETERKRSCKDEEAYFCMDEEQNNTLLGHQVSPARLSDGSDMTKSS
jgi:D-serine dehydratase